MSLLQKMKTGKKNYKSINFPGTEDKVAIVTLSSNQIELCKIRTEAYIKEKKIEDPSYQDMVLQRQMTYEFLRDQDDLTKKLAESFDDLSNSLDSHEIAYFVTEYNLFTQENSPLLNAVNEEQFEALKKTLPTMSWNDLNGESLVALRNFLMSLV